MRRMVSHQHKRGRAGDELRVHNTQTLVEHEEPANEFPGGVMNHRLAERRLAHQARDTGGGGQAEVPRRLVVPLPHGLPKEPVIRLLGSPRPTPCIDYGIAQALTTYGIIGIKVWVYKGDLLDRNEQPEAAEPAADDRRPRRAPARPEGEKPRTRTVKKAEGPEGDATAPAKRVRKAGV